MPKLEGQNIDQDLSATNLEKRRFALTERAKKAIGITLFIGLLVSPVVGRTLLVAVKIADTVQYLHDPVQRGIFFQDAKQAFEDEWGDQAAQLLIDGGDRFDEGKYLGVTFFENVMASSYGISVDYQAVYDEWHTTDQLNVLKNELPVDFSQRVENVKTKLSTELQDPNQSAQTELTESSEIGQTYVNETPFFYSTYFDGHLNDIENYLTTQRPNLPSDFLAQPFLDIDQLTTNLINTLHEYFNQQLSADVAKNLILTAYNSLQPAGFSQVEIQQFIVYAATKNLFDSEFFATLATNHIHWPIFQWWGTFFNADQGVDQLGLPNQDSQISHILEFAQTYHTDLLVTTSTFIRLTLSVNDLYDEASNSQATFTFPQALQVMTDYLSHYATSFSSPDEALLFLATAAHANRYRGTTVNLLPEQIDQDTEVVGLYLHNLNTAGLKIRDRYDAYAYLLLPLVESHAITTPAELLSAADAFKPIQGATFSGVIAPLDPSSLSLSNHVITDQDTLQPEQVAFPLPWSYIPDASNADLSNGPIELAFTRDEAGNLIRLQSTLNAKTDLRIPENYAKKIVLLSRTGVTIMPIADLVPRAAEDPNAALIDALKQRNVSSALIANAAYDSDLSQPEIGFGSLDDQVIILLAVSDSQPSQLYLLVISHNGGDPNAVDNNQDSILDINQHIKKATGQTVKYLWFSDPGHGLRVTDQGGKLSILRILEENETNDVIASFLK